jgi:redox-sensitive bicupin YhaK (pirin superfamily)
LYHKKIKINIMEKETINKITGTGIAVASSGNIVKNDVDELAELETVKANEIKKDSSTTIETVLHKANTRGHANHGWLNSYHTFSFANYYNPERMHFGVLRVLNDDRVDPGMGFGRHPHDNMEIISIPLEGDLEHKDSMGNTTVIKHGDIQAMSAGTGIFHSEYNKNSDKPVKFLQIWLFPKTKNVTPRYDQVTLKEEDRHNKLQQVLSPDKTGEGVSINQDAWFHMGNFDKDFSTVYHLKNPSNGVYAFVIKGNVTIAGTSLNERDGLGIWSTSEINIQANSDGVELLLMEVPMVA